MTIDPCPFCNGPAKLITTGQQAFVGCEAEDCLATGPQARGPDKERIAVEKWKRRDDDQDGGNKSKRGRGTDKLPVIGIVERGGRVVARPADKKELNSKGLMAFINSHVDVAASLLITDEFPAYRATGRKMLHATINHAIEYVNGLVHTNTMEGFWALVKRAWYGQHHHYSDKYASFYIAEACFKYNVRSKTADNSFSGFMKLAIC